MRRGQAAVSPSRLPCQRSQWVSCRTPVFPARPRRARRRQDEGRRWKSWGGARPRPLPHRCSCQQRQLPSARPVFVCCLVLVCYPFVCRREGVCYPLLISRQECGASKEVVLGEDGGSSAIPLSAAEKASFTSCSFHDKNVVSSEEVVLGEDGTTQVDISETITSWLRKHEGHLHSFRIDSSRWTDSGCLDEWLELLSEKSVEELELFNLGHKVTTVFPIQNLQSKSLKVLRIGFLWLNLDLFCFNYSALQILDLFSCALDSIKLSWIVTDCVSLKLLKIHYCFVDLKINSQSLEFLYSVGNIGNRIIIESAPKLLYLLSRMLPKQQSGLIRQRIQASISISNVPSLKFIKSVMLPCHKVTVNSVDIAKDIGSLHSLEGLQLYLEMSDLTQLQNLCKILESFPMLHELHIVRMDSIGPEEGLNIVIDKPFDNLGMINCVKNCLKTFSLEGFQGGASETHMIRCILKSARNLMELSTSRSESSSKKCVRKAIKEIKMYDRISGSCKLTFE